MILCYKCDHTYTCIHTAELCVGLVRFLLFEKVAAQEGAYVARLLNRGYNTSVEAAPQVRGGEGGGVKKKERIKGGIIRKRGEKCVWRGGRAA